MILKYKKSRKNRTLKAYRSYLRFKDQGFMFIWTNDWMSSPFIDIGFK